MSAIEPSAILGQGAGMFNSFFFMLGGLLLVGILGGLYYMSSKGKLSLPFITKFPYKLEIYEPSATGITKRFSKGRRNKDKANGTIMLEIYEGAGKQGTMCPLPEYKYIGADGGITLWSPIRDEYYPCKVTVEDEKINIVPRMDNSMKFVYAQTQEKLAMRNREKNWLETAIPIIGLFVFGLIMVMLIYVTMSQTTAYQAEVAQAFITASSNFACPTAIPPI